jgi:hypothetical protein
MNPYEHGEVFVTADGGEVDLDLGNYERFVGMNLSFYHSLTTGKLYKKILEFSMFFHLFIAKREKANILEKQYKLSLIWSMKSKIGSEMLARNRSVLRENPMFYLLK